MDSKLTQIMQCHPPPGHRCPWAACQIAVSRMVVIWRIFFNLIGAVFRPVGLVATPLGVHAIEDLVVVVSYPVLFADHLVEGLSLGHLPEHTVGQQLRKPLIPYLRQLGPIDG